MKYFRTGLCLCALVTAVSLAGETRTLEAGSLSVDSLLGKYDGKMTLHNGREQAFDYQIEVLSVDKEANTVALIAYCSNCETKEMKRNKCEIKEIGKEIKYSCKATYTQEEYIFNGETLKATGSGKKFPYSINVEKLTK
ncbi:MAG: hypothetical protein WCP20_01635 [Desulfuromonadales bacterium]